MKSLSVTPGVAEVVTETELTNLLENFPQTVHEQDDYLDGAVDVPSMMIEKEGGGGPIYQRP